MGEVPVLLRSRYIATCNGREVQLTATSSTNVVGTTCSRPEWKAF